MPKTLTKQEKAAAITDYSKYDFSVDAAYDLILEKGLSEKTVAAISKIKNEPKWMLDLRLKAFKAFKKMAMPKWGADLSKINFDDIIYYMKPKATDSKSWDDVPEEIKNTFERLGIPEAEREFLAGVGAQFDSEVVYHNLRKELEEKGIIFLSMDEGLKQFPEIVKKYFTKIIPHNDNKFAALNTAVWSGGSFVYVPKNVQSDIPLQAYFRINAERIGQFERTLIVAEPGSKIHYIEGCTAPVYTADSLHSAVVEVVALPNSKVRYTTIQNWSSNVYNLVTKRAFAYENATVEWVDGNLGSKVTMKYPAVYMLGQGAKAEILSIALAGKGQSQDAGAKAVHLAPNTTSNITSKSISKEGGRSSYRGILQIAKNAKNCKANVVCDALLIDDKSRSDTYPTIKVDNPTASLTHEATVGKIGEDQLFYLMSRGLTESQALTLIVLGFIQPFVKSLPMEYAAELNRLIELEMEGSIG